LLFKAVPSGGARHPVEALLWVRTDGVPEGLYHYSVEHNALHRLANQPSISALVNACPALRPVTETDGELLVVMLAAVVRRAMWRYRDPRSARAVLVDVGHVVQHLAELGAWAGWAWTDLPGFDAGHVADAADIDADTMPVLAMGALTR
jgi:SagB-type dehydrogenase family enzyme